MSNHQKRLSVPKSWPVERKTEKFTVKADAGPHGEAGVPLLIVLRDVLGYVDSRKEARFALNEGSVRINGDRVADEERPVGMFDILAFEEREEFYRVFPGEGGRLALTPIDADSAGSKLGKIVGKQHVPGGTLQLTLHDGETLRVDDEDPYDTGDSLIVDNETGEIVAHFVYEAGALVTAVNGAHSGEIGTVDEIQVTPGSASNNVLVDQDGSGGFETVEEYVVVIDENFTEDDGTTEDATVADLDEADDESEDIDAESDTDDVSEDIDAESDPDDESEDTDAESDTDDESEDIDAESETDDVSEDEADAAENGDADAEDGGDDK